MDWPITDPRPGRWKSGARLPLLLALLAAPMAQAQISPPGFGQFKHARWGTDEGAPNGLGKITQAADGYLWLGGDTLYRFDGVSFEQIDWPASEGKGRLSPDAMLVSRAGELWVGLGNGAGVAVYRGGRMVDTHMPDPPTTIAFMAQAPDGTIWAVSGRYDRQLRRFRRGRWESVGDALQRPDGAVLGLEVMADGGVWIVLTQQDVDSGTLAYLAPGANRFRRLPERISGRPRLAHDRAGALWLSDATGTRMIANAQGGTPTSALRFPPMPNARTARISFDRQGGQWRTNGGVGVSHIPAVTSGGQAATPYPFGAVNGLTSDYANASFVDREGNVWIVTEAGLDQFRRASATQEAAIPADPEQGLALAMAKDGSVYIESDATLFRITPGGAPRPILKVNHGDLAMCTARDGGIWLLQAGRTLRIRGDHAEASPGFPGDGTIISCAEDRRGRLWAAMLQEPLIWRDAGGWHRATGALAQQWIWDMAGTPSGDVIFTGKPDLATIEGDRLTTYNGTNAPTMIAGGLRDAFLSDEHGLVRLRNGRMQRLDQRRFPWLLWLRGLAQTPAGETWLVARTGIYRVRSADLDRAFDDPHAPLEYRLFNSQDGLVSAAQRDGFSGPQSAVGGDGRVWFLNRQGAAYFDPVRLKPNPLAPPVKIRSLASAGQVWRDPGSLTLPAGTRALDIAYAGLSLVMPQRVRFRYQLEGVDEGWVDAGARRTASYTNLGPGTYRFQVIAANNDGVWNRTGATLEFTIRPTFFQSWPFKLLCAAALLALAWLAYSMRMRAVAGRIRLRMAERFEERERIARELHDTLLQAIQSLTLRFQLAVDDLPAKQPGRPSLVQAIDTADRVIAEGRDRVQDLRSREHGDIEQIVRDLVAQQAFPACVQASVVTTGPPRVMDPLALDEVTRIAGEALFNVRRHADASRIGVEIRHGTSFVLCITDNGVGIDPELAAKGKRGHFGLAGMRERARKLRGSLVIRPLPDHGTELVLRVPGTIAYKAEGRGLLARLRSAR